MLGLGWQELLIVLVIILLIFGAGKLPQVMNSLGQGVKEFKTEANTPLDAEAAPKGVVTETDRPATI